MKHVCRMAAALIALATAQSLLAADKPMGPPKPAPEMAQLGYFAGTWHCSGKTFATPMGPEHATEGTANGQMALGGFRLVIHYDEVKTAANPATGGVIATAPLGGKTDVDRAVEAAQKAFDSHCFDSFGGACSQTTSGWKGDELVFEGSAMMGGQKMGARDTFTKVSATELKHKGEMQGADGKWSATDEETCHKAAKAAKK